ncbi:MULTISPECIES: hypothetical protein [Candidatus Ichthyocystis]|nr:MULTISPECIES: hypothetical protein [Ichthyocystis]
MSGLSVALKNSSPELVGAYLLARLKNVPEASNVYYGIYAVLSTGRCVFR